MNNSHLTAISRNKLSQPAKFLKNNGLLVGRILDYGCGRGSDVRLLTKEGFNVEGYDKHYHPYFKESSYNAKYDTIMCNYVLNVIPDESERDEVLRSINELLAPGGFGYVSVRNDVHELRGWTKRGTWQGLIELNLPVVKQTSNYIMYRLCGGQKWN
jgi:2-polyprenyl-3-methyl-5-hydroxy-6-metoxy-1,4-benzoquinol methylase